MHIRYVITPDRLAFITILETGRKFVVQSAFFRSVMSLNPRTTLGSTSVNAAQLTVLTGMPVKGAERYDDDLLTAATAI